MITIEEYFGPWIDHPSVTDEVMNNAQRLLAACANLEVIAVGFGVEFPVNPYTKSGVSGATYGGFRPPDCPQGAQHSSHKEGLAVDRFDPNNEIDNWCAKNTDFMEQCGIYIEAPDSTQHWSHWTIRAPKSGHRIFLP